MFGVRCFLLAAFAFLTFSCVADDIPRPETPSVSTEPYFWRNVVIGGGGFVTGIIFHPREKDLIYARTDVGGAYRWDTEAKQWVPLTDWIGAVDVNLMGIESIALDPGDPDRLYLAAGTYSVNDAAMLCSTNRGRTFERTRVPFRMGGNEPGRFNGERLAVDPNDGRVLFFGSRREGLWRSADHGATWTRTAGFPVVEERNPAPTSRRNPGPGARGFREQPVGIVSVVFEPASGRPGAPTPVLYAAISAPQNNFFVSTNGGVDWRAVDGQPRGLCPNHVVRCPGGFLYLTFGKEPGPNTMTDGAVWKFDPKKSEWTEITPRRPSAKEPFGYGAVAVDAQHPETLMTTTFARWNPRDEIFRSTDGGAHWTSLLKQARWDFRRAPYTQTRQPHWMGDIQINPFNSDQVLFTTGYGIWSSINVTAADSQKVTQWIFLNDGLEQTVPLALASPPEGAHLLSGLGDIDGFRHDELDRSPSSGTFAGPRFSNTEDLAVAGRNPKVIVRSGTAGSGTIHAAISADGGSHWKSFRREPVNNSSAGSITVSADGRIVVWTPRRGSPHWTADTGEKWKSCGGLAMGQAVVADALNPSRFYAFDLSSGKFLVSTNGAANFAATSAALPKAGDRSGGNSAGMVRCAPGAEGDLWLTLRGEGLFHSIDGGQTFTKFERVTRADSIGFGKAAAGKNYPAVYLAGEVGGLRALFRSDDAGKNWVRINDDQHQFGFISRVTGDPRIYGRVYFATGGRGIIYGDPASKRTRTSVISGEGGNVKP